MTTQTKTIPGSLETRERQGQMKKSNVRGSSCHTPSTLGSKNLPAGLSNVPLRESARRYIRLGGSVSGMWRRVRGEVLDMTISRVPRACLQKESLEKRRGFDIFSRRVGPGTWYPYHPPVLVVLELALHQKLRSNGIRDKVYQHV